MRFSKVIQLLIMIGITFSLTVLEAKSMPLENDSMQTSENGIIELTSENLENFLDDFVPPEMETAHVPGLVINVVYNNEVLISKGYGYASIEQQIPMTSQTNIRAGSVSKPILATGIIKLAELGVLDLNAPVTDYITDIELADEFGPAPTIAQLLTHMSGYPDTLVGSHSPDLAGYAPLGEVLRTDLPRRAFAADTVSAYSDWNFSLLGYAIEGATDQPYETVLTDLLFEPLGMEHTTYLQPLPEEIFQNLATGYGWNYSTNSFSVVPHDYVRMSPGIALVTNGEDMGNFLQMLLANEGSQENQILSDQSLALLLERQGGAHAYSRGWSYGFIENTISGHKVLYKDGNGIGFSSRVVLMPDQNLGIFVSTNHRNLGEGMWPTQASIMSTRTLISAILENFVPKPETAPQELQPAYQDIDLKQFEGHYQKAGISRNDFFKLEGLLDNVDVVANRDGTLRIGAGVYQPVDSLIFQNLENPDLFVIFVEDQENDVEFLTFGGTGSYQKVSWYQTKNTQIGLLTVITLISLSMAISWPFTRQGHWIGWAVSLIALGFIVGVGLIFVPEITDMLDFFKTISPGVQVLFTIPWLIGILAFSLPVFLTKMWNEPSVSWFGRIQYILTTAATFITLWMAYFWNLMLK